MSAHREVALAHLAQANEVRLARAAWKRELRELPDPQAIRGCIRMVLDPPWWARAMRVDDALDALPYVGKAKVRRALVHCRVAERRCLGELTPREREALYGWLAGRLEHRGAA